VAQLADLAPQSWDDLFDFLDPSRPGKKGNDRDHEAEARCLEIRRKLVCFFAARRCPDAEDLATDTILRVAAKCRAVDSSAFADRIGYFYAVAHNVLHESHRHSQRQSTERESVTHELERLRISRLESCNQKEALHTCLEQCVKKLPGRARRLIVQYYREEKTAKIESHRALAGEFGKSVNALRIEVHRIRKTLHHCVLGCMRLDPAGADTREALLHR
jgi:RNA polymerase sigma factor (sigma-70 family)